MIRICPASSVGRLESILPCIAEWVWEAGCPFVPWLWGSEDEGKAQTSAWLKRESSELGLGKITLLMSGEAILGGYVAMGGHELALARKCDLLDMLKVIKRTNNSALLGRMGASHELFEAVDARHYYLSRIGVRRQYRGQGLGRKLLAHYLCSGCAQGYAFARLDVYADKHDAIALYQSHHFTVMKESTSAAAGMTYCAMIRDLHVSTPEPVRSHDA